MSRLSHPNVVEFVGFAFAPYVVLVLAYAELGSLADVMGDETIELPWRGRRLPLALDAACGMRYLHTAFDTGPVVHRDLKVRGRALPFLSISSPVSHTRPPFLPRRPTCW